jgi:hypothetical protein
MRQLTGLSAVESANRLFQAKWNSIPHKRKMESWIMDVLENPFVRLRYFMEPRSLCDLMAKAGFSLYSSWPPYQDGLAVHWFKKEPTLEEQLHSQSVFISQNRLSHLFGRKHFLTRSSDDLEEMLWKLLTLVDGLIDRLDAEVAKQCGNFLSELALLLKSNDVVSDIPDLEASIQTIECFRRLFALMFNGSAADLVSFCNHDQAFIRAWGMPSHFAVFRKEKTA